MTQKPLFNQVWVFFSISSFHISNLSHLQGRKETLLDIGGKNLRRFLKIRWHYLGGQIPSYSSLLSQYFDSWILFCLWSGCFLSRSKRQPKQNVLVPSTDLMWFVSDAFWRLKLPGVGFPQSNVFSSQLLFLWHVLRGLEVFRTAGAISWLAVQKGVKATYMWMVKHFSLWRFSWEAFQVAKSLWY